MDKLVAPVGVVAHLKLDETTGLISENSSPYSGNATLNNFPTNDSQWTTGYFDGALAFDGQDDYVEMDSFTGISGGASRTVAAWIKTSSAGTIVSWGQSAANGRKWTFCLDDNSGAVCIDAQGGMIRGTNDLRDGQWHHIVAVLEDDGSATLDEIKLYIDGQMETVSYTAAMPIDTAAYTNVLIGAGQDATITGFFNGQLDDLVIFDMALRADQIAQLYHWSADSFQLPCGKLTQQYNYLDWADINRDCFVNLLDFSIMAEDWLLNETPSRSDTNSDNHINLEDFFVLSNNWLTDLSSMEGVPTQ